MRAIAMLHARTGEHRFRVDQAREMVDRALAAADSWYVSFSGGKDSTCVLALVRGVRPETPAQHSARHWILPETRELLDRTPNLRYIAYQGSPSADFGRSWDSRQQAETEYSPLEWLSDTKAIAVRGAAESGVFLGLRESENSYRRWHLRTGGILFENKSTGKWQSNPIAHWTALDVWAFIHSRGLDYNRAYDVLDRLGVTLERQRTGPLAVEGALPMGQIAILKRGWPSLYNRYAAAHPEARAYA